MVSSFAPLHSLIPCRSPILVIASCFEKKDATGSARDKIAERAWKTFVQTKGATEIDLDLLLFPSHGHLAHNSHASSSTLPLEETISRLQPPIKQQSKYTSHQAPHLLPPLNQDGFPLNEDEPKSKQQRNQYDHPPFHHSKSKLLNDERRKGTTSSTSSSSSSGRRNSPSSGILLAGEDDNDETDEEADVIIVEGGNRKDPVGKGAAAGEVEDMCLACEGECRCGGAKGATVFVDATSSLESRTAEASGLGGLHNGLKVRITMSSNGSAGPPSTNNTSSSSSSSRPAPLNSRHTSHIILSEDEDASYSPRASLTSHQHKKVKLSTSTQSSRASTPVLASGSTPSVSGSTTTKKVTKAKKERPTARSSNSTFDVFSGEGTSYSHGSATGTPPSNLLRRSHAITGRPLPTPSRSSLRQVLAASLENVPTPQIPIPTFKSPLSHHHKVRYDEEVSDLELDGESEGEEEEEGIEKAEERALRREFQNEGEEEETEDDEEEEQEGEGWDDIRRARRIGTVLSSHRSSTHGNGGGSHRNSRGGSIGINTIETEDEEEEDEDIAITDIPETGGRGVVTWSDYDSIGGDEEEEEERDLERSRERDEEECGEFEDELEELLALSEAVVGPVRDGEYELGEMWFEEISNLGDDESDPDLAEDDLSDDEGGDRTILLVDGWGSTRRWHGSNSSDSSSSDESDEYQMHLGEDEFGDGGGDTTDSLDSDDHIGLVRFGIEVESDSDHSSSAGEGGRDYYDGFPLPTTASLADVQAPTSADLASLPPQYLFFGQGGARPTDLLSLEDDTTRTDATTSHVLEGVNRSLASASKNKGKGRARNLREEEEDLGKPVPRSPAMGIFDKKEIDSGRKDGKAVNVMIDGSNTVAPSPFSKGKNRKKRSRELLEGTPSRRSRADSKISTASGRSITDGSLSGELQDATSPDFNPISMDFNLHDVLHPSVLQLGTSPQSPTSEDSQGKSDAHKRKRSIDEEDLDKTLTPSTTTGLSDLSRWNRIPIGAFRSSTMPTFSPTSQYFSATSEEASVAYSSRRKAGVAGSNSLYLPLAAHKGLKGSTSSLSHTLSSPHTSNSAATRRAIERRMLQSPLFGPVQSSPSLLEDESPKSRKAQRKEKRMTGTKVSPHQGIATTSTSPDKTAETFVLNNTALPPPPPPTFHSSSSPFLSAAQHSYTPSLHSPLFRSSPITSTSLE